MKKLLPILFCLLFLNTAHANTIKEKTAIKMLNVMNKNRLLEQHISSLIKIQVEQNPILAMKKDVVTKFFNTYAGFKSLKLQLAKMYTKELTLKEMRQFTEFFDTSVGQKMILKMPRLIGLSSNLAQKKIQDKFPELIDTFLKR